MNRKIMLGAVILVLNVFAQQEVKFCMQQYKYANDVKEECAQKCSKYTSCSAGSLIQQGYKIIDSYSKNITLEEFKYNRGTKQFHGFNLRGCYSEASMFGHGECFRDDGGWAYWITKPHYEGCECQGREYIIEKVK